jgi:hypothetical protein
MAKFQRPAAYGEVVGDGPLPAQHPNNQKLDTRVVDKLEVALDAAKSSKCSLVLQDNTVCDKPLDHKDEHGRPDPVLSVTFHIRVDGGTIPLPQEGTAAVLEEILRRYGTEGLTIPNQDGFEWYPPHAIRHVKVMY